MGATPLTLRCSFCKKGREWDSANSRYDKTSNAGIVATGLMKKVSYTGRMSIQLQHKGLNPKTLQPCGRFFWSTHPQAVAKWNRLGGEQLHPSGHRK